MTPPHAPQPQLPTYLPTYNHSTTTTTTTQPQPQQHYHTYHHYDTIPPSPTPSSPSPAEDHKTSFLYLFRRGTQLYLPPSFMMASASSLCHRRPHLRHNMTTFHRRLPPPPPPSQNRFLWKGGTSGLSMQQSTTLSLLQC